jgi:putative transcriptional regulator
MKAELFAELLASANQALEHAHGKRSLRTTSLPQPPKPMTAREIRNVRDAMQASQALLARYLNVSAKLVQAWEADRRSPGGPALVLLRIMKREPALVEMFYGAPAERATRNGKKRPVLKPKLVAAR